MSEVNFGALQKPLGIVRLFPSSIMLLSTILLVIGSLINVFPPRKYAQEIFPGARTRSDPAIRDENICAPSV